MAEKFSKDLEMCPEEYQEEYQEEEIRLLEDKPLGKLRYFCSHWYDRDEWLSSVGFSLLWIFFIVIYYSVCPGKLRISPTLMFMIHFTAYFFCFASLWALTYQLNSVGEQVIYMLLEQATEEDLEEDPAVWRRIAFKANQVGLRYRHTFYSGKQCECFFVRKIVEPMECNSCEARKCFQHSNTCRNFCKKKSNEKLVRRAVANYKKSIDAAESISQDMKKKKKDEEIPIPKLVWVITFCIFLSTLPESIILCLFVRIDSPDKSEFIRKLYDLLFIAETWGVRQCNLATNHDGR
ncbi:hypothetical protein BZL39_A05170 [Zygosaccharomyces parabailii]|nr:hypothetical protein BZL39_A05170 [Zygosaccharomyces parabailii]CDH12716.1 uncharacterized protein ZBAI_04502 [Zygosaccharomyces bailii ISA1307]